MAHTIESVIDKYVKLRDEKAAIAQRHEDELAGITEQMATIEKWLLQQMEKDGVSSVKTPAGTTFKDIKKTVKMADSDQFKQFVFEDVVKNLETFMDAEEAIILLRDVIKWDIIDFQVGKKGVQEYVENTGNLPPGVSMDTFTTVKIRRA